MHVVRWSILGVALIVALAGIACGANHAPPNLSPAAAVAWNGTRVIHNLDLLRDIAIDANKQLPTPLMSTANTRKVVLYHESALKLVHATPLGWEPALLSGLDELVKGLPDAEARIVAPYVDLLKTLLKEIA